MKSIPAAGARVEVSTPVFTERVETDEKGEFVFRALPEGPSQLAAASCASGLLGDGGTLRLKIEGAETGTSRQGPLDTF